MEFKQSRSSVFGFALFLSFATLLLIFIGGLVTSTGSGLSVPDWPLSFGQFFPPMVGGVVFEHGHRMVATLIGALTVVLAILLTVKKENRWAVRAGWNAVALVILQGTLGGMTVLLGLPPVVSVAHATLGQLFLCLVVAITVLTSSYWQRPPLLRTESSGGVSLASLTAMAPLVILLQLIIGATLRHSGKGLHLHMGAGLLVAFLIHWIFKRVRRFYNAPGNTYPPGLKNISTILLAATDFQILLGISTFLLVDTRYRFAVPRILSVPIVTFHVMTGAFLLAVAVVLAMVAYRTRPPRDQNPSTTAN